MQLLSRKNALNADSVLSLMHLKAGVFGSRPALSWYENKQWRALTFQEVAHRARELSGYLIEWGITYGDRIAILSESRPEWGLCLFATIRTGGTLVPLDTKLTRSELAAILNDAKPRVLFTSSRFADTAAGLKDLTLSLEKVLLIDDSTTGSGIESISNLKAVGEPQGRGRQLDEVALIIYTSGTTGSPKGVMITFANLIFQVERLQDIIGAGSRDVFLSILPMNHLLELTGGFLGVLHNGGQVCYCQSLYPQDVAQAMRDKKVTIMFTVPMFLKLMKNNIERQLEKSGTSAKNFFAFAYKIARWLPSLRLRRILFKGIHSQLGGRLRGFVSGGAALDDELAEFFDRIGLAIYQGYGLTETSPIVSANTPQHYRKGSVGRPLPGVQLSILKERSEDEEGEILTKGPHVMKGYYNQESLTAQAIDDDGWLHTGDIGRVDKDGFLYITGRLKNVIVLGAGKKVHPEEIEEILLKSATIKELSILGRIVKEGLRAGTEEVCAVVVPSDSIREKFQNNIPELAEAVMSEIDSLLLDTAAYKKPSRTFVHLEELPKTATGKVKKQLVADWVERQGVLGG